MNLSEGSQREMPKWMPFLSGGGSIIADEIIWDDWTITRLERLRQGVNDFGIFLLLIFSQ